MSAARFETRNRCHYTTESFPVIVFAKKNQSLGSGNIFWSPFGAEKCITAHSWVNVTMHGSELPNGRRKILRDLSDWFLTRKKLQGSFPWWYNVDVWFQNWPHSSFFWEKFSKFSLWVWRLSMTPFEANALSCWVVIVLPMKIEMIFHKNDECGQIWN